MELIPWTYNNPRVDRSKLEKQQFLFKGSLVEIYQDTTKDIDVNKNTAFKLWDGAYLLARFICENSEYGENYFSGKRCLELGAGCGLVGTVAWLLGAQVTLTDLPEVRQHLNRCCTRNSNNISKTAPHLRAEHLKVDSLDWTSPVIDDDYDVIFGSDIVYHPRLNISLVKTINMLCQVKTIVFLTYKPRGLGEDNFFHLLKKFNLILTEVSKSLHPRDFYGSDYQILLISRR